MMTTTVQHTNFRKYEFFAGFLKDTGAWYKKSGKAYSVYGDAKHDNVCVVSVRETEHGKEVMKHSAHVSVVMMRKMASLIENVERADAKYIARQGLQLPCEEIIRRAMELAYGTNSRFWDELNDAIELAVFFVKLLEDFENDGINRDYVNKAKNHAQRELFSEVLLYYANSYVE